MARQGGIGLSKSDRTFETLIEFVGFYSHSNADLACPLVVDPKTQKRIERDAKTKNKTLERQKRTSSKSGKTKKVKRAMGVFVYGRFFSFSRHRFSVVRTRWGHNLAWPTL